MTTWALVALAALFLVLLASFALLYTRTHPIEQETSWPAADATSTSAPEK